MPPPYKSKTTPRKHGKDATKPRRTYPKKAKQAGGRGESRPNRGRQGNGHGEGESRNTNKPRPNKGRQGNGHGEGESRDTNKPRPYYNHADMQVSKNPRREQMVYGWNAVLAMVQHRPQDVREILYANPQTQGANSTEMGVLLQWAHRQNCNIQSVSEGTLRITCRTPHHEGIAVVGRPLPLQAFHKKTLSTIQTSTALWVVLDGVRNPHNIGAVIRTAAFYGVYGVIMGGHGEGFCLGSSTLRVAEGAAEHLNLHGVHKIENALEILSTAGVLVLGLETDGEKTLLEGLRQAQEGLQGAIAVVFGAEREGLSHKVRAACSQVLRLSPRGEMEALNISATVAATLGLVDALMGTAR